MVRNLASKLLLLAVLLGLGATPLRAAEKYIVVASTTSTVNSGLFDVLLPQFTKQTGIEVRVVERSDRPTAAWRGHYDSLLLFSSQSGG